MKQKGKLTWRSLNKGETAFQRFSDGIRLTLVIFLELNARLDVYVVSVRHRIDNVFYNTTYIQLSSNIESVYLTRNSHIKVHK